MLIYTAVIARYHFLSRSTPKYDFDANEPHGAKPRSEKRENPKLRDYKPPLRPLLALMIACCATLATEAAQPVTSYTHFCVTCGVWGVDTFESESGQFIVHGNTGVKFPPVTFNADTPLLELQPQLVAVTAERVKRVLYQELSLGDSHRDKVHVILFDSARPDQPIGVISRMNTDGFVYQVGLPTFIDRDRLVKALVHALLLEIANHGSHRCAELPPWLVDGFSRQVLSSVTPALVANKEPLTFEIRGYDRLGASRPFLHTNTPMSVRELSFATAVPASKLERQRLEASAHLLVFDLLRVRAGRELMVRFLEDLPKTYNWQTALFSAYRAYFQTPLEFEKWWTLNCLDARNHDKREIWPVPLSLQRLDTVLLTPMELRLRTNSIPQRPEATLQEIIYSTDFGVQKEIFARKLEELFFLSINLAPQVRPLATAYGTAINSYLQKRTTGEYQPGLKVDPEQRLQTLIKETITTFDNLDRAREDLRAGRTPKVVKTGKAPIKTSVR
ncbi:MAG TPA: hypothetical protein VGR78_17070 [Verrucomicrobiae bacterium]|jgi:hypothetical protein|nr:hypothetical protein [Verrucomicrobiae bacterium]